MPTDKIAGSLVGQTIGGRYRLTKLLGEGGMGEVYAADHIHITKKVAVKLLHREISTDEQAIARFKQEAQSASSIGHDNIVRIDDFFELDDGRVCMCMEYLAGENLANVIHAVGADQPARGIEIMRQVCEGLSAAHALGIVHRDMKPENVFLTRLPDGSERAKLLDFGIAKVVGGEASNLTKTGTVFGTPHYMSPEQALGQTIDPRADIYSLGVMLYEMFAGEVPFKAETFMGVLSQHITEQPAQPSTVTPGRVVPAQIERVILKAMAKKAEDRFSSAAALKEALLAAASDLGWHVSVPTDLPAPTRRGVVSPTGEPAGGPSQPSALQTGSAAANRASAPLTGPASAGRPSAVPQTGPAAPASAQEIGGAPTMASVEVPQLNPATRASASGDTSPGGKGRGRLIALIIGAAALVVGGVVAALTWSGGADEGRSNREAGRGLAGTPVPGPAGQDADGGATAVARRVDAEVAQAESATGTDGARIADADGGASATAVRAVADATDGAGGTGFATPAPPSRPDASAGARPAATRDAAVGAGRGMRRDARVRRRRPDARARRRPPDARVKRPKPDAKQAEPRRSTYRTKIISVPSDAAVYRDGRKLRSRTPLTLELRPGERVQLRLAKGGRKDRTVTVEGKTRDQTVRIKLQRRGFGGGGSSIGIPNDDPGIPGGGL